MEEKGTSREVNQKKIRTKRSTGVREKSRVNAWEQ